MVNRLSAFDHADLVEMAKSPSPAAVELMLDMGVAPSVGNDSGETALHKAAYEGRLATVRLLVERGAELGARDRQFDATPLAFATVGSGETPNPDGDWPATVRYLLEWGASHQEVWFRGRKAPSREVADVLRSFGAVQEAAALEEADADEGARPTFAHPGEADVLAEVASVIAEAYKHGDLELFASVLAPGAHFGEGPKACTDRSQILARYQTMLVAGLRGQVTHMETAPGGVLMAVTYAGHAQGMGPPGSAQAYQVFRVVDAMVVHIMGYPDLAAARGAARG